MFGSKPSFQFQISDSKDLGVAMEAKLDSRTAALESSMSQILELLKQHNAAQIAGSSGNGGTTSVPSEEEAFGFN